MSDDHYPWAHTYLGHALYQQGRVVEAIASWQRADEVVPHSDAAAMARKKIQNVGRSKQNVIGPTPATLQRTVS